ASLWRHLEPQWPARVTDVDTYRALAATEVRRHHVSAEQPAERMKVDRQIGRQQVSWKERSSERAVGRVVPQQGVSECFPAPAAQHLLVAPLFAERPEGSVAGSTDTLRRVGPEIECREQAPGAVDGRDEVH